MLNRYSCVLLVAGIGFFGMLGDLCADSAPKKESTGTAPMQWDRAPVRTLPNGMPILHSRPGAPVSIFVDYQYESVDGKITPISLDKDFKTFNPEEQALIRMSWAKVASAFALFDVDVTTIEPAPDHPYIWQCVHPKGVGSSSSTGYVPLTGQKKANNGSQRADGYRWCGQCGQGSMLIGVIVHETGHAHGVTGHETYDVDGNRIGIQYAGIERGPFTRSIGPIGAWHVWLSEWGRPKKNPAGLFWVVNDIERIAKEIIKGAKEYTDPNYAGDGFRPDDHGNDIAHASPMTKEPKTGDWSAVGIIERYADKDVFSFDWPGGTAWIGVQTAVPTPLLDARATLYDAGGAVVAAADPSESMQAALRANELVPGKYYLEVASHGDYSELGRYEATVSRDMPLSLEPIAHLALNNRSLKDSSGAGRDGVWTGSAKWTQGPTGETAAAFDGTNNISIKPEGGRFTVPGRSPWGSPWGRTFAFWFKGKDANAGGEQILLNSPQKEYGYTIYLEGGKLKASISSGGGLSDWRGEVKLVADEPIKSGRWYHAALTHRTTFSKIDDTIALYLNGKEADRDAAGPTPAATGYDVGGPRFVGAIDDVWILGEVVPSHLIAEWARRKDLSQPRPKASDMEITAVSTSDSVKLSWPASVNAKGCEILRSVDNQHFAPVGKAAVGESSYTDKGLAGSYRYFYCVRPEGRDDAGWADITTRAGPVDRPRFIRVVKDEKPNPWGYHRYPHQCEGKYGITLLWFGPKGYRDTEVRIERSTDGKTFKPIITMPSATERVYYDANVAPATKYTYRFVTLDDAGDAASTELTATSASPPPEGVLAQYDVTR